MKSMLIESHDGEVVYHCLAFLCPGCIEFGGSGIHILPVNTTVKTSWNWNHDLAFPTLTPSILTGKESTTQRCHSFLTNGMFHYLVDSTHSLRGLDIEMLELPTDFVEEMTKEE